ncbi:C6 zinc finger protein [Colletotrichum sojae]|uniref:C6 zinc finger protein n=1 Tax=Colletotrichum sojae TaxID=2175907 RepID=A0A8H6MNR0_9PEZI|nr:C6 zinc finger protein [Colletotrichum sojae]
MDRDEEPDRNQAGPSANPVVCSAPAGKTAGSGGCCCGTCRKNKRRSHKKSRNGCQNCKRRKVKCDEIKPECGNCVRFSMHCDFAPPPATANPAHSPTASSPPATPAPIPTPKKRGRPRKVWDALQNLPTPTASDPDSAQTPQATPAAVVTSSSAVPPVVYVERAAPTVLNPDDLELLHHYMCHTSITLGEARVWREHVPRLGFQHHYVMHMVLAISAQHLARLRPSQAAHYEALAERHSSSALPAVTGIIPSLNRDNCQALYHTTVLVCLSTFARRPSPGHLLLVAEDGEVPWWALLRGVRFVVKTMGIQSIIAGWSDDGISFEHTWTHCPPLPSPVHKAVRWERRFVDLADLVATSPEHDRDMYTTILESLKGCFEMTFGTEAEPVEHVQGKFEVVMRWLYSMDDAFVDRLRENHVLPLVLLAHFNVLVQTLEHFWFMHGWSEHLMEGVYQKLDSQYSPWLQWPAEQIKRPGPTDNGVLSVQSIID